MRKCPNYKTFFMQLKGNITVLTGVLCRNSSSTFQQMLPARAPWGALSELRCHTEVLAKVKQFNIMQSNDIQFIRIQFIEAVSQNYTV